MATINTTVVTNLAAGKVFPNDYLGTVKHIPVVITDDVADGTHAVTFSEVLPPDTYLVGIQLEHSAIAGTTKTLDIGYTGDADAIIDGAALTSAGTITYPAATSITLGAPVDVGGKKIIGELIGQLSSDTIEGYILVVNNA